MRFQPSGLSYGDGQVTITPIDPPAQASSSGGGSQVDVGQYVDIGVSAARSLLGLDSDGRSSAATIEAQIEIAKKKKANNALPGAWYWDDRIIKLSGQLVAARQIADEEAQAASIANARDIGYTLAVFAGVLVIGGFAVSQIQNSRRTQAEIDRLRA